MNTFSMRTCRGLQVKKVKKPNLKNWNSNYLLFTVLEVSDNRALFDFI